MKMTKLADDQKALEEKRTFFDAKRKERRQNQHSAIKNGWIIILSVLLFDLFIAPLLGWQATMIGIAVLLAVAILVPRFIWAPWDVCWVSVVKPNYFKVLVRGGDLIRPIANGIAFTEDKWVPVSPDHPDAVFFDKSILGVHIIKGWPFTQVHEAEMEYKRYYEHLKAAPLKRELMVEFTLMIYPYYIELLDAKDANKGDVRMGVSWMAKMTGIKDALFAEATSMIDVCTPLIQGGMGSFISVHTVEQIRALRDVGRALFEEMPNPEPNSNDNLIKMIEKVYGMETKSISKIFFKGDNEEVEEAMNAKALAGFRRDAKLIDADAASRSLSITTIGAVIEAMAQSIVKFEYISDNQSENEVKKDIEEERKKALIEAKNHLTAMRRDEPENFEKQYGKQWEECLDLVKRDMAIKGNSFSDARTPDVKGGGVDPLSLFLTAEIVGNKINGGSKTSSGEKKEDKKKKEDLPFPGYEF
jgi:hypothetical protein